MAHQIGEMLLGAAVKHGGDKGNADAAANIAVRGSSGRKRRVFLLRGRIGNKRLC